MQQADCLYKMMISTKKLMRMEETKMRTLYKVDEFRTEGSKAIFTKQQAVAVTLQLLKAEADFPDNTPEETRILNDAMKKINFQYLDYTSSETDTMLDTLNVARFTTEDILSAIDNVVFELTQG